MLFAFLLAMCGSEELSQEKFTRWMTKNQGPLSARVTPPDFSITLNYLPADWLALRAAVSAALQFLPRSTSR